MKSILFVCLGNICRSPVAEGIMLHLVKQQGLNLMIDSAGTAGYHIGEAPDSRTIANALKNGVDLSPLRARQFETNDFETFDVILAMDKSNHNNVLKLARSEHQQQKVKLFLDYANGSSNAEVPDPYYGTASDFERVFQLVYNACNNLCKKLGKN